jgi:hypothetical protein
MPAILRSRLALLALMGAFLIPIGMSSLRGLTHVLVCEKEVKQPFTMVVTASGEPQILSSTRLARAPEAAPNGRGICGGLLIEPRARSEGRGRIAFTLPVRNLTDHIWRGTIAVRLGSIQIPVDVGEVGPGETGSDTILLNLDPGEHKVDGSLFVGP